jgi:hypothetical protein
MAIAKPWGSFDMSKYGHSIVVKTVLALVVLSVVACAATNLTNSWKSPDYKGPELKKLLVVGVAKQPATRRTFEDEFVKQIKAAGVDAVASYTVLPDEGKAEEARLMQAVKEAGADGALITRVVRVDVATQYSPSFYPSVGMGMYGGYSGAWAGYYDAPVVSQTDTVVLETSLYGANQSQLLWSGTTQTFAPTSIKENIQGFAKVIIGALKKDKFI